MGMPGPWEMALILVIVLILFGAGRLPQVFEAFGKGIKQFRDAQKDGGAAPKELPDLTVEEAVEVEQEKVKTA